jgi:hypothetical protein
MFVDAPCDEVEIVVAIEVEIEVSETVGNDCLLMHLVMK